MRIKVFAVRNAQREFVSAWTDEYDAKFEAARWSQDRKEDWDYVPAELVVEDGEAAQEPPQVVL